MKKLLAIILSISIIASFTACNGTKRNENDNKTNSIINADSPSSKQEIEHTGKKISGQITAASTFSEGLAFVCLDGDKEKTYCINKDGYIVFEIDINISGLGKIEDKFVNGLAVLKSQQNTGRVLCDTKGNITTPEDLGVTNFCGLALEGKYIIVEKITASYDSSKKEIGVINTDFEWVVELSESIYDQLGDVMLQPSNTTSFYYNDFCYFENNKKYLNLKTGEVTDTVDFILPSNKWKCYTDNTYRDYNENILLDLSDVPNALAYTYGIGFVNGKTPIRFHNKETGTYFFNIIDEKGEFLFDPIELSKIEAFYFDGDYLLVIDNYMGSQKNIKCYDTKGNLLGELDTYSIEKNRSYNCEISDGIITIYSSYSYSNYKCYYYNTDFTELF